MQIKFLKEKEIFNIKEILKKEYGADFSFEKFSLFLIKDKIFLVSREIEEKKEEILKIKIFSLGLFFGQIKKNNKILLSLEGAQLISDRANKNIVLLDEESLRNFLLGFNILKAKEINCQEGAFVLIKFKNDLVGIGQKRKNYIENLTVKTKRLSQF